MAGQLCSGTTVKNANVKDSKAYCEGYKARTIAASPTNPHASGSSAYTAFAAGVTAKADEASVDVSPGCCAPAGIAYGDAEVPSIVGLSESAADSALVAAGFISGTVTNTTWGGLVTVQDPVADASYLLGEAVDYTMSGIAVPDLVGMDEATADAALVAVGLISGTVTGTGTGGTVTVQDPVAATYITIGGAVDYTMSGP